MANTATLTIPHLVLMGEERYRRVLVPFGRFHFKYASGRQGDWPLIAFAARKDRLTIYLMDGFEHRATLLRRLGKHSKGKSCLHIKRLDDVDTTALRELVEASFTQMRRQQT